MRFFLGSIRTRLLLLVVLSILPLLALMLWTAADQRRQASVEARAEALKTAQHAAEGQWRLIEETRLLLADLARAPELRDSATCSVVLSGILSQRTDYANLGNNTVDSVRARGQQWPN